MKLGSIEHYKNWIDDMEYDTYFNKNLWRNYAIQYKLNLSLPKWWPVKKNNNILTLENYKGKLFESPDYINGNSVGDSDAYPFAVYENNFKVKVSPKPSVYHGSAGLSAGNFIWPGRIWINSKILTFWVMPDKTNLLSIVNQLSDHFNINVLDFMIEIHKMGKDWDEVNLAYMANRNPVYNAEDTGILVPVREYLKSQLISANPSQREYEEHLKSPALKRKKIIKGFGSENSKYTQKQREKMYMPFENKTEKYMKAKKVYETYDSELNESLSDLYNKVKDTIKTAAAKAELIQLDDKDTIRLGKAVWNKKKDVILETIKPTKYYNTLKSAFDNYKNEKSEDAERLFYEIVIFFYANLADIKANIPVYFNIKDGRLINMTSKTPNNPAGT